VIWQIDEYIAGGLFNDECEFDFLVLDVVVDFLDGQVGILTSSIAFHHWQDEGQT